MFLDWITYATGAGLASIWKAASGEKRRLLSLRLVGNLRQIIVNIYVYLRG